MNLMLFPISEEELAFPDPRYGEESGLFAFGGDLSPERLMLAYSLGIFPWFSFKDNSMPLWFCPMERFVIFPDEIHVSHSVRNILNRGIYRMSVNEDFRGVIAGCAEGRIDLDGAWLGEDMTEAYTRLHDMGFAASVEVWHGDKLAGGLYGVTIGNSFFGESMFSREPGASKLALVHLARTMQARGAGGLIDCQFETPHLRSMGGRHIPYSEYLRIIRRPGWI